MHESKHAGRGESAVVRRRLSGALCLTVGLLLFAGVAVASEVVEPLPDREEGPPSPIALLWFVIGDGGGVSTGDGFELTGSVEELFQGGGLLADLAISAAPMAKAAMASEASLDATITEVALAPVSPNPNRGDATLSWALPRPSKVRLTIHDVMGREIAVIANGVFEGGRYTRAWRADRARGIGAAGIYFVRLSTEEKVITHRMVVVQ